MPLFARKPPLPADLHEAWQAFLDCAEVIEGGRRVLLGVLPTGRVEPAPVGVGTDAVRRAITDARAWMPRWRVQQLEDDWQDCLTALDEAEAACDEVDEVAGTTRELEELLEAVQDVIEPLDVFADAERAWRRGWKLPRDVGGSADGAPGSADGAPGSADGAPGSGGGVPGSGGGVPGSGGGVPGSGDGTP